MANSTTLTDISNHLVEQNKTLSDVNEGITSLVSKIQKQMDAANSARGDELEEKLKEKRNKKKSSIVKKSTDQPKTLKGNFLKGATGIDWEKLGLPAGLGIGAGLAAVGPFLARAIGRMIPAAAGAFLGAKYLDPLLEKYWPKWLADPEIETAFGTFDASTIVSSLAGMVGLMYGPGFLGGLIGKTFSKFSSFVKTTISGMKAPDIAGADKSLVKGAAKAGNKGVFSKIKNAMTKTNFRSAAGKVLKGGLIGAAFALFADEAGAAVENYTNNELAGDVTESAMNGIAIGSMFGPWGMLVGALGGIAVIGIKKIKDVLDERRDALVKLKLEEAEEAFNKAQDRKADLKKRADALALARQKEAEANRLDKRPDRDPFDMKMVEIGAFSERQAKVAEELLKNATPKQKVDLENIAEGLALYNLGKVTTKEDMPSTDANTLLKYLQESGLNRSDLQTIYSEDGIEGLRSVIEQQLESATRSNSLNLSLTEANRQSAIDKFINGLTLMSTQKDSAVPLPETANNLWGNLKTREDFDSWFKTKRREDQDFIDYMKDIETQRLEYIEKLMPPMPTGMGGAVVAPHVDQSSQTVNNVSSSSKVAITPQTSDSSFSSITGN